MKPRHKTQWTFTSIGPGDRSEEARPLMTIIRCQTENNMRESCKSTLTLYTEALDPTEQATKCCHCGNEHEPSHKGPTTLLGMSKCIYLIQESFTLPCIPFFYSIHLRSLSTGALYKQRHRYRYSLAKDIPVFSIYITAALGLPFHKPIGIIFWSIKILNPLVTDMLV